MGQQKTARIAWQGTRLNFHGILGSGYEFDLKGPADSAGASPMELMLASVAGCTAMDVVHVLRKKRQQVSDVAVEISGVRADDHPKVYTEVEIVYVVRGESVDPKAVEQAIELSQTKYCSASIMFKRAGTVLRTSYRIDSA